MRSVVMATSSNIDMKSVENVKALVTVKQNDDGFLKNLVSDIIGSNHLVLELVSAELDPKTNSERETIKGKAKEIEKNEKEVQYEATFELPEEFGNVGAVLVENDHHHEIFLKNIVLHGFPDGPVNISCESWIQPKHDAPIKRLFFTNKMYLPSQTPSGLRRLRQEELMQLRGNGDGERKTSDRIYDYDVYNDLGDPDINVELKRPVLGGKQHPYPRRCRTGRKHCDTDPSYEKRGSKDFYVPRDEAFAEIKKIQFNTTTASSGLRAVCASDVFGASRGPTPRPSNYEEDGVSVGGAKTKFHYHGGGGGGGGHYPAPNPGMFSPTNNNNNGTKPIASSNANNAKTRPNGQTQTQTHQKPEDGNRDLHMFVWSSSNSPVSDVFGGHDQFGAHDQKDVKLNVSPGKVEGHRESGHQEEYMEKDEFSFGNRVMEREMNQHGGDKVGDGKPKTMPPASVMTRLILIMVWRKLIRNPNTYSSLIGLTWSLVSFRWNVEMPAIIAKSISILSDAGLGMAMFSLGLFMALQPKIIACGNSIAAFSMTVRFLAGPAVMAVASFAVGLKGVLFHVAIVQAALPQGIVPFVFAKEYNVHPDILSTGVIFGMLVALPITLVYYILMGL